MEPVFVQFNAKPTDTAITEASKKRTLITRNQTEIIIHNTNFYYKIC